MRDRIRRDLIDLMAVPGLSGHEGRIRAAIRARLPKKLHPTMDALGNMTVTFPGHGPRVMLFTHMDQLGFIVRKIEADGGLRVERLGGVPERALAAQPVLVCLDHGPDIPGVIANKSHHATTPEEKYTVVRAPDLRIDCGFSTKAEAEAAGIRIGAPVVYRPNAMELAKGRIAGTSVDDRAGCAVLLEVIRALASRKGGPEVHVVFTVQEEFNLRGALVAAQTVQPEIAIQVDLMNATDTPDMADRGEMHLGQGPGMSLYSFHGRGTLNGVIPHPSLVATMEAAAEEAGVNLQRSAQVGVLTDLSYVQLVGAGVAAIDVGFPMRYSHSAVEMVDLADLEGLTRLLITALDSLVPDVPLERP